MEDKLKVSFEAREYKRRKNTYRRAYKGPKRPPKSAGGAGFVACALVAAVLFLAVSFSGADYLATAANDVQDILHAQYPLDELLGKLTFVNAGAVDVFSATQTLEPPLADCTATSIASGTAQFSGKVGDVYAACEGTVTEKGDDKLVIENNRYRLEYRGLTPVAEVGQPVKAKDAIGTCDGTVELTLYDNGFSADPAELMGIKKS